MRNVQVLLITICLYNIVHKTNTTCGEKNPSHMETIQIGYPLFKAKHSARV